jgi:hypothetical protein
MPPKSTPSVNYSKGRSIRARASLIHMTDCSETLDLTKHALQRRMLTTSKALDSSEARHGVREGRRRHGDRQARGTILPSDRKALGSMA